MLEKNLFSIRKRERNSNTGRHCSQVKHVIDRQGILLVSKDTNKNNK